MREKEIYEEWNRSLRENEWKRSFEKNKRLWDEFKAAINAIKREKSTWQ